MILEIDLSNGTVYGGCHIRKPAVGTFSPEARVDFDISGTVSSDGVIDAELVGTYISTDGEYDWRLTGTFTGTLDTETTKAQGEYELTIEKYKGGSGNNPELERLQWVAGPTPQYE